jgi:hypothetical protein
MDADSRILHWAHYDHIKPWVINEWKDKVELFTGEGPGYEYPDVSVGNVPNAECKPAFDLWDQYYNEIKDHIEA